MSYRPKDAFYRKAKKEGYRSRAAYKLMELARRFRLIKPGDRVVDLGAAPGGWLQVAAELAGPKGKVVGIDLQTIVPLGANVVTMQGDATAAEWQARIKQVLGAPADAVLSDLAPHLSGIRDADIARSIALARMAHRIARELLRPGGGFLVKTFVADELREYYDELKRDFDNVERSRPEATRKGSSEIYFVAREFKGNSPGSAERPV
ncbi:MAG TPA: RlmE family RNA methyltransferase [Candidatus Binatia bacterium]|nr:RlmE family RNA methyltransferase [Candidatus Binatia bacterium]